LKWNYLMVALSECISTDGYSNVKAVSIC
jgi:hypothetical protein